VVKLWYIDRTAVSKRLGTTALGYIFQIFIFKQNIFGAPTMFSVVCNLWKTGPIFLDPLQTFYELWYKAILIPRRLHSSTNKIATFFSLQKITTFMWYPTVVAKNRGYLTSEDVLAPPYLTLPQTPGLDPPLTGTLNICNYKNSFQQKKFTNGVDLIVIS